MKIELWPIKKLIPYARNARKIPQSAIDKVAASIQEFGFRQPIVVDTKRVIIVGHVRLLAAQQLEWKEVPVHVAKGLTPAQVRAYRLMDNRSHQEAEWDYELLSPELAELKDLDFDLSFTGFEQEEIATFLAEKTEGLTDEDAAPPVPEVAITVPGDLWILGNHRLLCGDSTSIDAVERLMDGQKADMVFTDPPYGIDVVKLSDGGMGKLGGMGGPTPFGGKKRAVAMGHVGGKGAVAANWYAPIIGDDTTDTAAGAFNVCAALSIPKMIFWGGNCYAHVLPPSRCWIVWDKNTAPGASYSEFELAWTNQEGRCRMFRHTWSGMVKASEHNTKRVHPTQKPVALAEWTFGEFGSEVKSVLDMFLGSGSTLIACEKTNRACFGMEMSPDYCDVIVRRWQEFTGKTAHLEDGRTPLKAKKVKAAA